nr:EcsC family protein [Caldalkalibacillus salinus]
MQKLPDEYKVMAVEVLDQLVLMLSQFCHKHHRLVETEKKILLEARLYDEEMTQIEELRRLKLSQRQYIEEKMKSRYVLYSLVEGGVAGTGNPVGLALDLPALLTINLKMIQAVANAYGYSLTSPPEQVLALKVLHAGTLSKAYHEDAWEWMVSEYHKGEEYPLYVTEHETVIQSEWLETIAKQWIKAMSLYSLKKASKKGVSVVGVLVGATLNAQFSKQVGEFASRFYQYRVEQESQSEGALSE